MNKTIKNRFIAVVTAAITMGIASGSAFAGGFLDVDFNPAEFNNPLVIDNPYWPLNPDGDARTFTYEAETEDGCVLNKIYINGGPGPVTGVKKLNGIGFNNFEVLEVLDIESIDEDCDGPLPSVQTELTFDWYAQDDSGNIWYMGEYSRNFELDEDGVLCPPFLSQSDNVPAECTEGSWEAGVEAGDDEKVIGQPGIVVPSDDPFDDGGSLSTGTYYFQEVAFEAEDMAKILRQHASLTVEDGVFPGEYENCRKVKEWNPLEHGESVEHKWYCHDSTTEYPDYGPGLVLIEGVGGGITEVETLTDIDPAFSSP